MRIRFFTCLVWLLGSTPALADTNAPATNGVTVARAPAASESRAQIEMEYRKLLAADDAAQAQVDQWILENARFAERGGGRPAEDLKQRIEARFAPVRKAYEDFLARHPDHVATRLAYGSFLNDLQDEDGAVTQWEKARELDPKNPAAWNNLANQYAHRGPVAKAFEYFDKAIELNPREALYYHSLGTSIYLFRAEAMKFYHLTEPQVFDKVLELYAKAEKLDPDNFPLATDIAQTYYGIKPMRTEAALRAWECALKLAGDEVEREGVYTHQARIKMGAGRFDEARQHLAAVTNAMYAELKNRLLRNLEEKRNAATNSVPPAKP